MKITKILITFISFLLISQISFAAVDACPGESRNLSYSSSNVPSGTCTTNADTPFDAPPAPTINSSGTWPIAVPNTTPAGSYLFGLTCGLTPATGDTLNVLDKNSQACCGTGPTVGKVWSGVACVVEQSPTGTFTVSATGVTLGQSVTVSSTANDGNANMIYHLFDWTAPDCVGYPNTYVNCWSWETGAVGGVTSPDYATDRSPFVQKGSDFFSKTFTPTKSGTYYLYSGAYDTGWATIGGQNLIVCPLNAPWDGSACNPSPIGSFDSISTSYPPHAYGWAADASNNYATPIQAAFWLQPTTWLPGEYLGTVTCNSSRPDVQTSLGGSANANLGCDLTIPSQFCDGTTKTLGMYAIGVPTPSDNPWIGNRTFNCVVPAGPSGSISATPCVIPAGQSSCNTSVSWTTANLTAAATAVTYPTSQTLSTLTSSAGVSNNITGLTPRTYYLYHNGAELASTSVSPTCITGSGWNGSSCVNPTTGNISASSCNIIAGESTCNSSVTWSTANAASPNVQLLAANGSDTTISTAASSPGLGQSSTLSFGTNTFNLKNGATILDTDTASATCAPLSTWNGSLCISTQPTKISLLLAQPEQISCPGGSDGITLKLAMSNTVGRVCKITATSINTTFNSEEKGIQMTAINQQLSASKYKSSNSEGSNKSLLELMADRNGSGFSGGTVVLSSNTKLSSGKRLFGYSTRFKLECDSSAEPLATQYRTTNSTYSSKSVDVLSTCIGQD